MTRSMSGLSDSMTPSQKWILARYRAPNQTNKALFVCSLVLASTLLTPWVLVVYAFLPLVLSVVNLVCLGIYRLTSRATLALSKELGTYSQMRRDLRRDFLSRFPISEPKTWLQTIAGRLQQGTCIFVLGLGQCYWSLGAYVLGLVLVTVQDRYVHSIRLSLIPKGDTLDELCDKLFTQELP